MLPFSSCCCFSSVWLSREGVVGRLRGAARLLPGSCMLPLGRAMEAAVEKMTEPVSTEVLPRLDLVSMTTSPLLAVPASEARIMSACCTASSVAAK